MSPTTPPAPAQNSEICDLPARRLAALIKTGQLSSREVMTAFLKQIDDLNPRFNAIISRVPHAALLAQADAADQAIARKETVGALHGLPMAVKDTTDTAGIVTTYGSPIYRNDVPAVDGLMVSRLRKAGAIFIGKTNVPEFGLGSHSFNPIFGATGNAWDPRYNMRAVPAAVPLWQPHYVCSHLRMAAI